VRLGAAHRHGHRHDSTEHEHEQSGYSATIPLYYHVSNQPDHAFNYHGYHVSNQPGHAFNSPTGLYRRRERRRLGLRLLNYL
jgi:hypothetical protein